MMSSDINLIAKYIYWGSLLLRLRLKWNFKTLRTWSGSYQRREVEYLELSLFRFAADTTTFCLQKVVFLLEKTASFAGRMLNFETQEVVMSTFTRMIRQEANEVWEANFRHPFVQGIANGTLSLESFRYYLLQDSYYLSHFARIQAIGASRDRKSVV